MLGGTRKRSDAERPELAGGFARGDRAHVGVVRERAEVTELGTVYAVDEIAELADFAHAHGLLQFVDGARLPSAAAASAARCTR
jgi:threonine aldolase